MIYSMTGFARGERNIGAFHCSVEIKSLNGKQFEIYSKLPQPFKSIEIPIRNHLKKWLERGSIDISINLKQHGANRPLEINKELFSYFLGNIETLCSEFKIEREMILATILRLPEVVGSPDYILDKNDETELLSLLEEVATELMENRRIEGRTLEDLLTQNIAAIVEKNSQIELHEEERKQFQIDKLNKGLEEIQKDIQADRNRFEQELIYYIEKMDISEEKNRLRHHCDFFLQTLNNEKISKGKTLGFILQEIGREINTMGAKASFAPIQKMVIEMKDHLEQAKEQIANVL